MNRTKELPKQFARALIDAGTINVEKRQFTVVFATETPVFRRHWEEDFNEVLSCQREHIRAERLDGGVVPLLNNHDRYSGVGAQFGSVISWEVAGGECRATIQFSTREELQGYWNDIEAGIIRGISVGYIVWEYQREVTDKVGVPIYRAVDWEPTEVSLAPVPADYKSKVRNEGEAVPTYHVVIRNFQDLNINTNMVNENGEGVQANNAPNPTENGRSQAAPAPVQPVNEDAIRSQAAAAERQRCIEIRTAVRTAGLEEAVADEMISAGTGINEARAQIFERMAQRDNTPTVRTQTGAAVVVGVGDEGEQIRAAMSEAIIHRAEPGSMKLSARAQDFKGMKLMDMVRHMLQMNGENPFKYSQREAVTRAIATTDFPDLLTSTVSRQLRRFFEAQNTGNWQKLATRTTVSDFREKTGVQVDGAVTFDKIAEGGEYKSAKIIQNSKATIAVDTYGKLVKITRQAIINDDLDVFSRIPKIIAQGALNLQAKMVWDMITKNAKTPDGKTLFHADHKNLAAAGAAISETTLNAALVAMMLQQSPAGEELGLTPKYLVVPVEKQIEAQKLLASIVASKTGDVNPFVNAFEIISEARLSRESASAWYMAADPSTIEGLMYAYLDGEEGLYTESRTNFDDDSVETKARMEFGVAAWEHRGWYKNPGA